MGSTLDDVRDAVMQLPDGDRQRLAEEIITARWNPQWREAWGVELERRRQRLASGEDRELTLEEFFSDDDTDESRTHVCCPTRSP
jgi:hypothetical protein